MWPCSSTCSSSRRGADRQSHFSPQALAHDVRTTTNASHAVTCRRVCADREVCHSTSLGALVNMNSRGGVPVGPMFGERVCGLWSERARLGPRPQVVEVAGCAGLPKMDAALEWANRLPTYGHVEVRELLQF